MPPARETLRQTASATPDASAPGIAAVSSSATRTAVRSRTTRISSIPWTGSSTSSSPAGESWSMTRTACSTSHAPFASRRSAIPGPAAARTAATRPASSATPTFSFTQENPSDAARAASMAASSRETAPIVALTATASRTWSVSSALTGRPSRCPARSHRARSIAASAWGRSATARQRSYSTSPRTPSPRSTIGPYACSAASTAASGTPS